MPSLPHFPLQGKERCFGPIGHISSKLSSCTILTFCRNNQWDSKVGASSLFLSLQTRSLPHNYPGFTSGAHFIFCPVEIHASLTSALHELGPVLTTLLVQSRTDIIPSISIQFLLSCLLPGSCNELFCTPIPLCNWVCSLQHMFAYTHALHRPPWDPELFPKAYSSLSSNLK